MSKARGPYRVDPLGYKKANEALDKKAENARELGLMPYDGGDYEPAPVAKPHEQEPVAYQYQGKDGEWRNFIDQRHYESTVADGSWLVRALYTRPQAREPLTDEQIEEMWQDYCKQWKTGEKIVINFVDFARAIEAAHGIKENT